MTQDSPDHRHRRHEARRGRPTAIQDALARAEAEDAARTAENDEALAVNALERATRDGDGHEMQAAIEWLQLAQNNAQMARHHVAELGARQQAKEQARRARKVRLILAVAALLLATVGAVTLLVLLT